MTANFRHSKCPYWADTAQVNLSHGHPFSRAYFKHSKSPLSEAEEHVYSSHGQPFSWAYFRHSKWPFRAAQEQVIDYVDGKIHGKYKEYKKGGILYLECDHKDGKKHGYLIDHINKQRGLFLEDVQVGWNKNNILLQFIFYS